MIYKTYTSKHYDRVYRKLAKRNPKLNEQILKVVEQLELNPFKVALKTHSVSSRVCKEAYSSSVTKDIRIIWIFDKEKKAILLLSIGGHSGSNKVYKHRISISL
ncbi:MAG: hypothetical protein WC981_01120 [Candidatus Dojkabacteria bacterium]|jgi:mRNA-degrading endonuclease YafQ of YafQ-DinJ toxin-antitoxin module